MTTIYEDAKDLNTRKWTVLRYGRGDTKIRNVFDKKLKSRIIRANSGSSRNTSACSVDA